MKSKNPAAVIPILVLMLALPAGAQRVLEPGGPEKDLQETGRVLGQAQGNARFETSRQATERTADHGRLGELAAEAQKKLKNVSGEDERKMIEALDKRLEPAMKGLAPEGRAIVAQSSTAPAMRAPDPDAPATSARAKTAPAPAGAGADANAKKANPAEAPPKDIDIKSEGAVYLDSAQALAVFTDDVVLDHPQFHMTSDKLEVYFIKESAPKPGDAPPPVPDPANPPKAQPANGAPATPQSGDAKLKTAHATGRKVVVQKLDENGEPQIGICRDLTYMGDSGDVILREMPQVQRGNNVIIARDPSTYMVMKQNGELKVHGPADTKIQSTADTGKPKSPAATTPPAAPAVGPGAPVLTPKKPSKK